MQRSASETPNSASSTCSPQPDQVNFWQFLQTTREHMRSPYLSSMILALEILAEDLLKALSYALIEL